MPNRGQGPLADAPAFPGQMAEPPSNTLQVSEPPAAPALPSPESLPSILNRDA